MAEIYERLEVGSELFQNAERFDKFHKKHFRRRRGDRAKSDARQLIEEIAVNLFRKYKRVLKQTGLDTEEAQEKALKLIAKYFRVKPATLYDWYRRVPMRRRAKRRKV